MIDIAASAQKQVYLGGSRCSSDKTTSLRSTEQSTPNVTSINTEEGRRGGSKPQWLAVCADEKEGKIISQLSTDLR